MAYIFVELDNNIFDEKLNAYNYLSIFKFLSQKRPIEDVYTSLAI